MNIVGSINVLLIQIFVAVGLGGTVLIAQYFGGKQLKILGQVVNGTLFGAILTGLGLAVIFGILHTPILQLLFGAAAPKVMDDAKIYMLGVLAAIPLKRQLKAPMAVCVASGARRTL